MLTLIQITDVILQEFNKLVTIISIFLEISWDWFSKVSFDRNHSFFWLLIRQRVIHFIIFWNFSKSFLILCVMGCCKLFPFIIMMVVFHNFSIIIFYFLIEMNIQRFFFCAFPLSFLKKGFSFRYFFFSFVFMIDFLSLCDLFLQSFLFLLIIKSRLIMFWSIFLQF